MATFTVDPTVPPNSENPQNGATRIRNVAGWLLDVLGLSAIVPSVITIPTNPQIDLSTGRLLSSALPGVSHLRTISVSTSQIQVFADIAYSLNPGLYLTQST